MTQKEIKELVKQGIAKDITTFEPKEIAKLNLNRIALSFGTYGMNGGLFKDNKGNLYAITSRNGNLFYIS